MPRYKRFDIFNNSNPASEFLRKKRGNLRSIRQYATPIMTHPTVAQRASLATTAYIWTYGDRFYQLAHQYYKDVRYWWIIAWYNGYPTEAHIEPGTPIEIPVDIQAALKALRSY